jgi:hypothetical protein
MALRGTTSLPEVEPRNNNSVQSLLAVPLLAQQRECQLDLLPYHSRRRLEAG